MHLDDEHVEILGACGQQVERAAVGHLECDVHVGEVLCDLRDHLGHACAGHLHGGILLLHRRLPTAEPATLRGAAHADHNNLAPVVLALVQCPLQRDGAAGGGVDGDPDQAGALLAHDVVVGDDDHGTMGGSDHPDRRRADVLPLTRHVRAAPDQDKGRLRTEPGEGRRGVAEDDLGADATAGHSRGNRVADALGEHGCRPQFDLLGIEHHTPGAVQDRVVHCVHEDQFGVAGASLGNPVPERAVGVIGTVEADQDPGRSVIGLEHRSTPLMRGRDSSAGACGRGDDHRQRPIAGRPCLGHTQVAGRIVVRPRYALHKDTPARGCGHVDVIHLEGDVDRAGKFTQHGVGTGAEVDPAAAGRIAHRQHLKPLAGEPAHPAHTVTTQEMTAFVTREACEVAGVHRANASPSAGPPKREPPKSGA